MAYTSFSYNQQSQQPYNSQPPIPVPVYSPTPGFDPNSNPAYSDPAHYYIPQPQPQTTQQFAPQYPEQQPPFQPYPTQQPGFPNTQSYEFDYQPVAPAQTYPQSQTSDMFIGQMTSNLTSGGTLAATALQFAPSLAATASKEFIDQNLGTFQQSKSVYKSYWDVDTSYVLRKLFYLLFPINSSSMQSSGFSSFPTQGDTSRSLNSPDLYIPSMSLVTYILMVGYVLGTQGRFAPDLLGITASSALVWLAIELCCCLLATYLIGMYSAGLWHKLSVLSGYKFFYMVCCIGVFVVFGSYGYYISFLATSLSSVIFSVQNLRAIMRDQTSSNGWYLMLAISILQPPMVYWLTWHLVHYTQ